MKNFILILVFIFLSSVAKPNEKIFAQLDYSKIFNPSIHLNTDVYTLNLGIFVSKSISLNYSFSYVVTPENSYFRIPLTTNWGYELFKYSSLNEDDEQLYNDDESSDITDIFKVSAILLFFVPQGISYHSKLSDYLSLELAFNPLQTYKLGYESINPSVEFKFHYLFDKIILSPHFDLIWIEKLSTGLGISFGVRL